MEDKIFSVTRRDFESLALEIFQFQYRSNLLYRFWVDALGKDPGSVNTISRIPFLPIGFFKTHKVLSGNREPLLLFESSGTTGTANSRHYVVQPELYKRSFLGGFEKFYGPVQQYCILGLLPSYLERKNSSLVMMVNELINLSGHHESGFYLYDHEKLHKVLLQLDASGQPVLLIGVTFALLDFAEKYPMQLKNVVIMETGGMKGRREELTREQVHALLIKKFGVSSIHSEYGMTELLSQAYSKENGVFESPSWMRILIRDDEDPLHIKSHKDGGKIRGALNIIDLANLYSCSFIATDDVGSLNNDGSFTVEGRLDYSDLRGCSLMTL